MVLLYKFICSWLGAKDERFVQLWERMMFRVDESLSDRPCQFVYLKALRFTISLIWSPISQLSSVVNQVSATLSVHDFAHVISTLPENGDPKFVISIRSSVPSNETSVIARFPCQICKKKSVIHMIVRYFFIRNE